VRIFADVFEADGAQVGAGPVTSITNVTVQRVLDGVDTLTVSMPGADKRAFELFTHGRTVRLYGDEQGAVRELGRMVIVRDTWTLDANSGAYTLDGPSELVRLKWVQTWAGYVYGSGGGATFESVITDLLGLTTGWTAEIDSDTAAKTITGRLESASLFSAIQGICKKEGVHFRQKPGAKVIQIGAFGDDSGVRVQQVDGLPGEWVRSGTVIPLGSLVKSGDSENVYNEIVPRGAGDDEAALTLDGTTRGTGGGFAYDPVTITRGSDTFTGLRDDASVSTYGRRQRVVKFDIAPVDNSAPAVQFAKDALYDAAAFELSRAAVKQDSYEITVSAKDAILPGDKISLRVRDTLRWAENVHTGRYSQWAYVDIDGAFWVLEASEDVSGTGTSTSLVVSNVDRAIDDAARALVGAISDIRTQSVVVKQSLNHYVFGPEQVEIDASNPATVRFPVGEYTQSFVNARLRVLSRPFTATSKAAAHRHMMFKFEGEKGVLNIPRQRFAAWSSHTDDIPIGLDVTAYPFDLYTFGEAGDTLYEIQRDDQRPAGISISVNGTVIASGIGTTDTDLDASYNVTDALNSRSGGIQGVHEIELNCTSGQGEVVIYLDILELIVAVKGS
jgi:hypothetical protein